MAAASDIVGFLRTQHATAGQDLKLTVDIDIQRAAELALGESPGAVVAMDPRNGEILAYVSHPSYDPNAFSVRISRAEWTQLISNPNHPLIAKLKSETDESRFADLTVILFDQALLSEGGQVEDPAAYVLKVNKLLQQLMSAICQVVFIS